MKIISKFQNSDKTLTRQQIEQNKRKQEFLNQNGYNIKVDGNWGPWQQRQYNKIKSKQTESKQNWFTKIMLGAAMAENPAVITASGWQQDKEGNYVQKKTKGSDQLADNLATLSWMAPTHPGNVIIDQALKRVVFPTISFLGSKAIKGATQLFNKSVKILRINKELTKGIKENSIMESYNRIPANKDIGTVYDYLDFLDNIFPKSKMNGVYYHGGSKGITQFESAKNLGRTNKGINSGTKDYGIYFTNDKEIAKYYAGTHPKSNRELYTVKLNMNRPVKINTTNWYLDRFKGTEDFAFDPGSITQKWYNKLNLKQYNSIYHTGKNPFSDGEIVMFNPEDIHIMGTPQESVMFREYKKFPIKRQVQLNEDIPTMQQQYDFGFKNIIKAAKPGVVIGTPLLIPSGLLIYDKIKREKQKEKINKKRNKIKIKR